MGFLFNVYLSVYVSGDWEIFRVTCTGRSEDDQWELVCFYDHEGFFGRTLVMRLGWKCLYNRTWHGMGSLMMQLPMSHSISNPLPIFLQVITSVRLPGFSVSGILQFDIFTFLYLSFSLTGMPTSSLISSMPKVLSSISCILLVMLKFIVSVCSPWLLFFRIPICAFFIP